MKSILLEVRRKEEGESRRGRAEAGAAESGDNGVRMGGQGQTGKGGQGQAGASGARHATGHQEGKGEKGGGQGRQWPQPQRSFKQPPPWSPPQVSAAVQAEEEREERRRQTARCEALAHMGRQRVATRPRSSGQTQSTGWTWGQGGEGWSTRVDRRVREGCTADSPVVGRREGKGRQDRAAQQRRCAPASGRESKRMGAGEVDMEAARCRAGMWG